MKEFLKSILVVILVYLYKAAFIFAGVKIFIYGFAITFGIDLDLKGILFMLVALAILKSELLDTNTSRSLDK